MPDNRPAYADFAAPEKSEAFRGYHKNRLERS